MPVRNSRLRGGGGIVRAWGTRAPEELQVTSDLESGEEDCDREKDHKWDGYSDEEEECSDEEDGSDEEGF